MKKVIFHFLISFATINVAFSQNSSPFLKKDYYSTPFGKKYRKQSDSLIGTFAKDFKFRTIKGDTVMLSSLEGKVVLLTTMFSFCSPCIREISLINRLQQYYKSQDIVFITISHYDTSADLLELQEKLPQKGYERYLEEIVLVPASYLGKKGDGYQNGDNVSKNFKNETNEFLKKYYLSTAAPRSYFIDKEGVIRFVSAGYLPKRYDYFSLYTSELDKLLLAKN